jgi:hypothetical protein
VTRNYLLIDLVAAAVIAGVVLIVSPGPAVDGLLALLVLLICGISLLIDSWLARRRQRRQPTRRPGPITWR